MMPLLEHEYNLHSKFPQFVFLSKHNVTSSTFNGFIFTSLVILIIIVFGTSNYPIIIQYNVAVLNLSV